MSTPCLLIIQPDETAPLGPLGDWLTEAGAELDVRLPPGDQMPGDIDGYQGVICLGGGMNAEDDQTHPWLAEVRSLLAKTTRKGVPTLGICLGGQLLAVATGGRVARGDAGPEVGAGLVSKKDAAWTDPLFAELPLMPDVMQFHEDVITALPPGAVLLASAPRYPHQAFRLGRYAYGLQFHIETSVEVVQSWAAQAPALVATARQDAFTTETLTTAHNDLAEAWRPFVIRFVNLCAGTLAAASSQPPSLPLTEL
ncbi:MAG TPA: type 1 glutamine amidotransferase [Amycolatopsis sp.]|uniref:type 1 glutamine amidotransferase n=1 Tax=Amycolatopsis sp. TaxID=37632 RepID=UPI002B4975B3|nr:type 1 glutamine amidotransferase [Amycolatopsis sp.]HKS48912.1 type 1 glutamine amidotransferase [Amycolatopsis sp.]